MALKFKNRLNTSVTPRVWVSPTGTRISWAAHSTLFENFLAQVWAYCDANNLPRPTEAELEDLMCRQSPQRDCTGNENFHAPPKRHITQQVRSGGCKSCRGK